MKRSLYHMYTNTLPDSALRYVIESIIPYTKANLAASFSPGRFIRDIQRISQEKRYGRSTLEQAYVYAQKIGYIDTTGPAPVVSEESIAMLKPYEPIWLKNSRVMVIFDIPETHRRQRRQLRTLLRELKFVQTQKSVWTSRYDSREIVSRAIKYLGISKYTDLFEAVSIS